jgi:hypothetical protein
MKIMGINFIDIIDYIKQIKGEKSKKRREKNLAQIKIKEKHKWCHARPLARSDGMIYVLDSVGEPPRPNSRLHVVSLGEDGRGLGRERG